MEKKTPLYQTHVDMGGKIVEFGGFLMPVQYPSPTSRRSSPPTFRT